MPDTTGASITFGEYAERVRRLAGALHALGITPGDTLGFMLTNRPEFHLLDAAVMHLGAIPFSIYNTSAPDQISYLLADAANRVMVVEAAFVDRAIPGISHAGTVLITPCRGSCVRRSVPISDTRRASNRRMRAAG